MLTMMRRGKRMVFRKGPSKRFTRGVRISSLLYTLTKLGLLQEREKPNIGDEVEANVQHDANS